MCSSDCKFPVVVVLYVALHGDTLLLPLLSLSFIEKDT